MSDFNRDTRIIIPFYSRYQPKKGSSPNSDRVKFGRSVGRMYKIFLLTKNCELPLTEKVVRFLCNPDSKIRFQNYLVHLYLNHACINSEVKSLFAEWSAVTKRLCWKRDERNIIADQTMLQFVRSTALPIKFRCKVPYSRLSCVHV